jgi:GNAT superfamily N-acetyltransferase
MAPFDHHAMRRAEACDAEFLPAVEHSAATLFASWPALAWIAEGEDLPVARYREVIAKGASWVAVDADDRPLAFLIASSEDDALHICELGVHRQVQRQGIGRMLLAEAIAEARRRGLGAVTLTTFRDVPWNAPFYAALGFEQLSGPAVGDRLAHALRHDAERGLPADTRCAMRLDLGVREHNLLIRPATEDERAPLEALQWRASLGNAGDRDALLANPDAIELPLDQIRRGLVFVADLRGRTVGFAAVLPRSDGDVELDGLFVDPVSQRRGIGQALIERCAAFARGSGAAALHVVGNPNAEAFYRATGFELMGRRATRFGPGLLLRRGLR